MCRIEKTLKTAFGDLLSKVEEVKDEPVATVMVRMAFALCGLGTHTLSQGRLPKGVATLCGLGAMLARATTRTNRTDVKKAHLGLDRRSAHDATRLRAPQLS